MGYPVAENRQHSGTKKGAYPVTRRPVRMLCLRVPCPPPLWKRYRRVYGVGRVKTAEYRAWSRLARLRLERSPAAKHIGGPVSVAIHIPASVLSRDGIGMVSSVVEFLGVRGAIDCEDAVVRICLYRSLTRRPGELLVEVHAL